ncbi:MAG: quinone oxidoreductase family protein [Lishizhenia sp.]
MKTHAFQLVKNGKVETAFKYKEIELPSLANDELLIETEAFGLNYADVMARNGLYRECPPLPAVIGYEVVGVVKETGKDVNSDLIGKRVVAFCRFGGYAKHVITKEFAVVEIDTMPAGEAMCLATQYVTAFYMCNYLAPVYKDEKVLIHAAAGGVGTALIQLLKLKGAHIIAKTSNRKKEQYLKNQGVDHILFHQEKAYEESLLDYLGEQRLDVSFNPVAGASFKKDFALLGSGGRLILFGGSERSGKKWGILSTLNFVRKMGLVIPIGLMMRSKNILGVNMLKLADNKPHVLKACLQEVVDLAKSKKITPQIGGNFKHTELEKAHEFLESGKSTGKIIVTF